MKKWLIVLIVTVLLAGLVTFSEIYVNNTLNTVLSDINILQTNLSSESVNINTSENIQISSRINNYWEHREKIICLGYNHKDMEKIGEQATKIKTLVLQNDKKACSYELEILKYYVEGYKDIITCNFQNIL